MPIRINLLAEQQAAEEARRRDPVKRAIFAGSAVAALMVLWILSLHFSVSGAKADLAHLEKQLQSVEAGSKEALANHARRDELEKMLSSLDNYASNRFFWAPAFDALQRINVGNVRITSLKGTHYYRTNAEVRFNTNIILHFDPPSKWKFWASPPPKPDILAHLNGQLNLITNRLEYRTNAIPPVVTYQITTNLSNLNATVQIIRPIAAAEHIVLTIQGRNYGNPPGRQVEEFYNALANLPYFKENLHKTEGQGIRLKERSIKPEMDPYDPVYPNLPFIHFTIECHYQERVFTND